jgi:hypothetical protein
MVADGRLLDPGARRNTCALGQRLHPPDAQGRKVPYPHLPSEEEQDAPVVICSELPNNGGTSVTYAAEQLAAEVIRSHRSPTPLVWIEHRPKESTNGGEETFELVVFSSY